MQKEITELIKAAGVAFKAVQELNGEPLQKAEPPKQIEEEPIKKSGNDPKHIAHSVNRGLAQDYTRAERISCDLSGLSNSELDELVKGNREEVETKFEALAKSQVDDIIQAEHDKLREKMAGRPEGASIVNPHGWMPKKAA